MKSGRIESLPEFSIKPQSKIRNRKKKEKMEGYNDLKPKHQPYHRDHHNYLLDDEDGFFDEDDYRGYER